MTRLLIIRPHSVIIIPAQQRGYQDWWGCGGGQGPPVDPDAPHGLLGHGLVQEVGEKEEDEQDQEGGQDGETPAEHREQEGPRLGCVPKTVFSEKASPRPWRYTWKCWVGWMWSSSVTSLLPAWCSRWHRTRASFWKHLQFIFPWSPWWLGGPWCNVTWSYPWQSSWRGPWGRVWPRDTGPPPPGPRAPVDLVTPSPSKPTDVCWPLTLPPDCALLRLHYDDGLWHNSRPAQWSRAENICMVSNRGNSGQGMCHWGQ